ncbi:hypothetical protein ACWGDX_30815 [Streptomyces sp. NPDC055025]
MTVLKAPTRPVFRKALSPEKAKAEIRGWHEVSGRLRVPELLGCTRRFGKYLVMYEDVFAGGRCGMLLGDLIATADRDPGAVPRVIALMDAVCDDLVSAVEATGQTAPLSACVPALYQHRIRPGGRVEAWYLRGGPAITTSRTGVPLSLNTLAGYDLVVNGTALRLDLPGLLRDAREALRPDSRWVTALTQGDPTEPNIGEPVCWLDFEYAGRNTIAGEIANLLWYLLAMGGWLVPAYQPDVYARTLRLSLPPCATPLVEHAELSQRHRRVEVQYSWPVGPGRRAAITQLLDRTRSDLGPAAGLTSDGFMARISHFLAVRILGVIPPGRLTATDLLLLLAKLAESQDPEAVGEVFTRTASLPPTGTSERKRR